MRSRRARGGRRRAGGTAACGQSATAARPPLRCRCAAPWRALWRRLCLPDERTALLAAAGIELVGAGWTTAASGGRQDGQGAGTAQAAGIRAALQPYRGYLHIRAAHRLRATLPPAAHARTHFAAARYAVRLDALADARARCWAGVAGGRKAVAGALCVGAGWNDADLYHRVNLPAPICRALSAAALLANPAASARPLGGLLALPCGARIRRCVWARDPHPRLGLRAEGPFVLLRPSTFSTLPKFVRAVQRATVLKQDWLLHLLPHGAFTGCKRKKKKEEMTGARKEDLPSSVWLHSSPPCSRKPSACICPLLFTI